MKVFNREVEFRKMNQFCPKIVSWPSHIHLLWLLWPSSQKNSSSYCCAPAPTWSPPCYSPLVARHCSSLYTLAILPPSLRLIHHFFSQLWPRTTSNPLVFQHQPPTTLWRVLGITHGIDSIMFYFVWVFFCYEVAILSILAILIQDFFSTWR